MADAFEKPDRPVPTAIGDISISLYDNVESASPAGGMRPAGLSATVIIQVLDANGAAMRTIHSDLFPKLTPAQQTTLTNFMAGIRTKATAEVLA